MCVILCVMNPLRKEAIERALRTPLSVRFVQALEAMRLGIVLKRSSLRERYPNEGEDEIEARLRNWLMQKSEK